MYHTHKISVIVPCYNEQEGLAHMLPRIPAFVDEVVVVNNASTDQTATVAKQLGAIVIDEDRRGYGQAILTGLSKAGGDILVVLDGDGTYPPEEIAKLLDYQHQAQCDLVSGCRYPLLNPKTQPLINQVANQLFSCLLRALFQVRLRDSQSGMMAFKKDLLDKIRPSNVGMGLSQEIKLKTLAQRQLRFGEVPISYGARLGDVKFNNVRDSVKNIWAALRLWKQLHV